MGEAGVGGGRQGQVLPRSHVYLGLSCCSFCSAARAVTAEDTSMSAPKGHCWAREEAAVGTTSLPPTPSAPA